MKTLITKLISNLAIVLITAIVIFPGTKIHAQNDLWCMEFSDDQTGFTVGDNGTIKLTTDGGSTWTAAISGTNNTLKKTAILNNDNIVVVGLGGIIIKTTDFGNTWVAKNSGTTTDLYGVSFSGRDAELGVAVGNNGTILRTTDQGDNWEVISSISFVKGSLYTAVSFASATNGIIVGNKGTILLTMDGGFTWSHATSNVPNVNYKFVIMLSEDVAYASGENGTIIKTTDGGSSWVSLNTNSSSTLYRIRFADDRIAISVGTNGEVLKTTDGGDVWNTETSGTSNNLNCLFVVDENTAYTGGQYGIILKTTDGGTSWYSGLNKVSSKPAGNDKNLKTFTGYPNPSNPVTTIKYYIASASVVTLKIYDIVGREVKTLVSQSQGTGTYSAMFDGSNLPSGVYFGKLTIQSQSGISNQTLKILLVK